MVMFKSLMLVIIAMLALTSCKKDEVKAYSAGCQFGASAMAQQFTGLPIPAQAFEKPCDEVAQDHYYPKPSPAASPSAAPSASPSK
jgi:hypothetical protein